jgi:paraquat-inducible protein B
LSKTPNSTLIGSFVLAALAVAAASALYFGSVSFSSGNPVVVVFFDESVSGLLVGAKVKLRGVPIGSVKEISLQFEGQKGGDPRIPVLLELDLHAMRRLGSSRASADPADFRRNCQWAIEQGLRARLQLESLITGLFFVEFDFVKDAPPPEFVLDPKDAKIIEMPAVPSPFAAINQGVGEVMAQIALIPVGKLGQQLLTLLERLDDQLAAVQSQDLVGDVSRALETVDRQLSNPKIGETVAQLNQTLVGIDRLSARLEEQVKPLLSEVNLLAQKGTGILDDLQSAAKSLRQTSDDIQRILAPESSLRYNVDAALAEIASAASAIERLADQLERNPRSLISGKARTGP